MVRQMTCVVCAREPAAFGLLCESCRDDVAAPLGLLPQQVLATIVRPTDDALVDQWGQPHRLEASMPIGRTMGEIGILILDASVSRHHAQLTLEGTRWLLRDLGSANGTFVNEVAIGEVVELAHGDRIAIGAVGFYLVRGLGDTPAIAVDPSVITTIQAVDRVRAKADTLVPSFEEREDTDAGLPSLPLAIIEPTGGGGGMLQLGDITVQLSASQVELVALLARRMREESGQPTQVRGFVRSSELVGSLSWDTRAPDDNNVKQLVRRTRRQMIRAGLGDLIESRQRFGYRLRMIPR
jgi:pSer/pThr/pTyr-binding forkhead associated (FHA) protein